MHAFEIALPSMENSITEHFRNFAKCKVFMEIPE